MLPSKPSTLLPSLNWHDERPFAPLLQKELPASPYHEAIERILGQLWVDEQYDFHLYKKPVGESLYESQVDVWTNSKTRVEEEFKSEEKLFQKLVQKFEEQGAKEEVVEEAPSTTSEEEVDNDITPDTKIQTAGKKPQECKRTLKQKQKHEAMLAKSIKSSMASSQQKLMDLQKEMDTLEVRIAAYQQYASVAKMISVEIRKIVLQYETTHDRSALLQRLHELCAAEEAILGPMRGKCSGSGLCSAHYLPLDPARYGPTGMIRDTQCRLTA
jgi:hypothetical protein